MFASIDSSFAAAKKGKVIRALGNIFKEDENNNLITSASKLAKHAGGIVIKVDDEIVKLFDETTEEEADSICSRAQDAGFLVYKVPEWNAVFMQNKLKPITRDHVDENRTSYKLIATGYLKLVASDCFIFLE